MEFRILGPVEAIRDGRPLRCTGRPLRLLALLLVERGRIVPVDAAIDALWDQRLPAHPENALQVIVSRLRRVLGEDAVEWRSAGYRLAPGEVDADRFERLARDGRAAIARGEHAAGRDTLAAALALWRGEPLEDVRYEPYAVAEAERLEDQRLICLGARIDADLALGRQHELVGELQSLVAQHPVRESLRGQLMLALYRCDRQADALAVFEDLRRVLLDELGLDPSADLRAVERSILRHEAGLPAPRAERREIVCVAAELRATTGGRPLDPELLRAVISRCHAAAEDVARAHGGPLLELRGDGVAAVFGSPVAHEDDAGRAERAATALMAQLGALGTALARRQDIELLARAGIAAGPALTPAGARGGALPLGDVVASAARLAREAAPGAIALDERTRALLGAARAGPDAPLVGRGTELDRLERAFDAVARTGAARIAAVIGEPGIGKSRIARELARRLGPRATVLSGRCLPYGEAITYWPIREMVVRAAAGRPLEALTAGLDDGATVAAAVAGTLGLRDGALGEAAPWAFRRLFAAVARDAPAVLVFEDLHWAEPALLDLVARLADEPAPLLVLALARPELLDAQPGFAAGGVLRLGGLGGAESGRLLAGRAGLEPEQRVAIAARARGNPLFLEQLAAHVAGAGDEDRLPPALEPLLAARLDLLGAPERALLEAGAVEGERFHLGGVLAVTGEAARAGAAETLDRLVARELLLPAAGDVAGEPAWRFRHALVREAAYASLPRAGRAEGHERLAGWLAANGDGVPEADARIGSHLERAHAAAAGLLPAAELAARAAQRLGAAADRAHRRGDLPDEIGFLERATALPADDDGARAQLLPALAAALFEAGSMERGAAVGSEALALGERLALPRVRWRAAIELERLHAFRHPETVDPDASLAVCHDAVTALGALGDDLGLARAHYLTCELVWLKGHSESGYRNAARVVEYARRAGSGFEIDTGVSYMAWALVVNDIPATAAIRECEQLEHTVAGRFAALSVRGFLAVLKTMTGEDARRDLAAARRGLRELGLRQASVWMAVNDAFAETLAGDPVAAERALDDAERLALEIGDRWFLSTVLVDRAHAVLAQGRPDAAARAVARIDTVPAPSDMEWRVKRHAARGRLAALEGDAERALEEARAATGLADATEMLTFRADAYRDLAEVAARTGRRELADRAVATALALYDAKENAVSAARLRAR